MTSFNGSIAISVDSDNPNASYTIPTSVNASSGVANLSFSSTTVGTYTI